MRTAAFATERARSYRIDRCSSRGRSRPCRGYGESLVLRWAAHAFDIHLTVAQAFSVLVGLNLGTFVPSPGALGSLETAGTAALVLCGASRPAALAFMFVYHLTQLAPALAAGVAILIAEGELLFVGTVRGRK